MGAEQNELITRIGPRMNVLSANFDCYFLYS